MSELSAGVRNMATSEMQKRVEAYWDAKPCDSEFSDVKQLSPPFFLEVEAERYRLQSHIAALLDRFQWTDKCVLEIGTGVGTDARQMIKRGASYTGINIDAGSTLATAAALKMCGLPGCVLQRDATRMDFPDWSFDFVYTFGVLHHIPDVESAMREILRVLKPGGELLAMLYNRNSINYAIEIKHLRRVAVQLLRVPGVVDILVKLGFPRDKLERHRTIASTLYRMRDEEWLSRNTDGPDNPYSRVYDEAEAARLFAAFDVQWQEVFYFNPEHWGPVGRLLPRTAIEVLGRRWGWHRVIYARKPCLDARIVRLPTTSAHS